MNSATNECFRSRVSGEVLSSCSETPAAPLLIAWDESTVACYDRGSTIVVSRGWVLQELFRSPEHRRQE